MTVYQIITTILTIVFGFFSLYIKSKQTLVSHAKDEIVLAEKIYSDTTSAGTAKFQFVVDSLYNFLPAPMRLFFSKEIIGSIVQTTFDTMEKYATQQLDRAVDKIAEKLNITEDTEAQG